MAKPNDKPKKPPVKPAKPVKTKKGPLTPEELAAKKAKEKKRNKQMYWGGGIFFFLLVVYAVFAPSNGSIQYGVCRTLIEMNEPFPQDLKIFDVEDDEKTVRIYFSSLGTFGEHRSNYIDCTFQSDKDGNVLPQLEKVDMNGKKTYAIENPDYIKKFNIGVPAIVEHPGDLALPWVDTKDLKMYWEAERR